MGVFAVLGLGGFGYHVTATLATDGHEVIAIDSNKEKIQSVKEIVTQAILTDATDKETLKAIGIQDVDAAIISLGEEGFESAMMVTLFLKEAGVKNIIAKVANEDQAKILTQIGATEVVFPEKDMAIRLAKRLGSPNVYDQIDIGEDLQMVELRAPSSFIEKTVRDLDLRRKHNIQVIVIKRENPKATGERKSCYNVILPLPNEIIRPGDHLTVMGNHKALNKIKKLK
ncbi:potassium transporter TrkA [bacterium (candidate division B38) B3_B38]|nr:MAG: potassium transporter TrkA [bacterium (candidate division B38) B3_B38]